jgi:hypothetical protein
MKIYKFFGLLTLALSLTVVDANAASADKADGNWYVGGGVGAAKVRDMCPNGTFRDCDDSGGAFRVFGGFQANQYFALEASLDLDGEFKAPGARDAGYDGSTGAYFFALNAIGFLPVANRVSLYGGLSGAFSYVSTDVTARRYHNGTYSTCYYDNYDSYYGWYSYCTDNRDDDRDYHSDSSMVAGALAGVDVRVANHIHVRAQAQRYFNVEGDLGFGGRSDVDQVTINGLFMFR